MSDGSLLNISSDPKTLFADIKCEKVGAREAQIIENDVRAQGPTRKWRIVMDLSDVTLLASMGLGMLVSLHKTCTQNGGKLIVCNIRPDIAEVLRITHLERVLKIVKDREAAVKAVG